MRGVRNGKERGFTLVEVAITVAILALAAAVIVPAISNVSRAELREAAAKLAGTLRATYDEAALTGKPHRLVFTPGSSVVKLEVGEQPASGEMGGLASLAQLLTGPPAAADAGEPLEVEPPPEILAFFGVQEEGEPAELGAATYGLTRYTAAGKELRFDEGVKVADVWIEGMREPAAEGTVYLPFFPHGYTLEALIHLTNEDGQWFTVSIEALSGKTAIFGEYVQVPQ